MLKESKATLALDSSEAFDILDHELVLKYIGAGPKMISWTKSFFKNCSYSVKFGKGILNTLEARYRHWSRKMVKPNTL